MLPRRLQYVLMLTSSRGGQEQEHRPWWRTTDGLEHLRTVCATIVAALPAGLITILFGGAKGLGLALILLGAAASIIAVGLAVAVGRVKSRAARDQVDKDRL